MHHKAVIRKIMKEEKPPAFAYQFQALIFKKTALYDFIDNCKNIVSSVAKTGRAAESTETTLRRRQQLGLKPVFNSDQTEIAKIVAKAAIVDKLKAEKK